MDQSRSTENQAAAPPQQAVPLPKRSFSVEFFVGLFTLASFAALAWLAVGLGGLELSNSGKYFMFAEFDNVSGLEYGAAIEIAGVKVGEVSGISFEDPFAVVTMKLDDAIKVMNDDRAAVRTKGIIGDRYIKIMRGASEEAMPPKSRITQTESVIDIEDLIGKIVHNFTSSKES